MYSGEGGLAGVSMHIVGHFAFLEHNTSFDVNLASGEYEGESEIQSTVLSVIHTNALGFAGFINEVSNLVVIGEDSIIGK